MTVKLEVDIVRTASHNNIFRRKFLLYSFWIHCGEHFICDNTKYGCFGIREPTRHAVNVVGSCMVKQTPDVLKEERKLSVGSS